MTREILLEVCCNSVEDAFTAQAAGADRIELNSGLLLGGLTPSIGEMLVARTAGVPVMAMVRPREGWYCYSQREFAVMKRDAEALLNAGASGIVFGVTHADGAVDVPRCAEMMRVIGGAQSVFHRAIDRVPNWHAAFDALIELGVTRVLTGGLQDNAIDGAGTIRQMIQYARGRLQICPGGGVRPGNAAALVQASGCTQLHTSMRKNTVDASGHAPAPEEDFPAPRGDVYLSADAARIRALLENLGR